MEGMLSISTLKKMVRVFTTAATVVLEAAFYEIILIDTV